MVVSTSTTTELPPEIDEPIIPEAGYGLVNHGTLKQFVNFCRRYIRIGEGIKKPLVIESFQLKALHDYFDGVVETIILIPKGNGKSTLLAALALYHLYVVADADIKIVAASRPGAEQIFKFAEAMVRASKALARLFKVTASTYQIKSRRDLSELKALPAEESSIDGKAPTLVLADELHHWKKAEVYAMLAGGCGELKRGGRLFGISTAGADKSSFLGQMRENVLADDYVIERSDFYTYARQDQQFALHEWSLPDKWDHTDFASVKKCNPLAAITEKTLAAKFKSPTTVVALWCRLHCNQWVQDGDALIDAEEWDLLKRPGCRIDDCEIKYVGADFGWRKDTTALVPVGVLSIDPLILRVDERLKITPAPQNGKSTSVESIKAQFREFHALWPDMVVVLDPNAGGNLIAEFLDLELGVEVVEQSQDPSPMAHAAGLVSELVRGGRLEHPAIAEFTRQVTNAPGQTVDKAGDKMRFGKHSTVPNDAAIALAMPVRQAHVYEPEEEAPAPVFYS